MKAMSKALDNAANIATVVTCIAIGVVLAFNKISSESKQEKQLKAAGVVYVSGTVLQSPASLSYEDRSYTVLVGLNSRCRYCADSMPELQRLNEVARQNSALVRVVAVAAEPIGVVTAYLQTNSLSGFVPLPIDKDSPIAEVVGRTPSMVLINRRGEVLNSWPGLVTESRMNELLERLRQPALP